MRGKWTEGPWTVEHYGGGDSLVLHSDGNTRICFMATPGSSPRAFPTIEANARLIAAAPALYEALHLEVRNCPVCKGDGVTNDTLEHILGHIPASEKVECTRCKNSRAALSLAHPPSNHTEESKP